METLELARTAERLGYHRFWVSEHHNTYSLAGSSPEVLLGAIGGATRTIRIGSGGVMLPHYSPFKVAENFSLLSTLYPHRVDLGIGRAPGSDMETAKVLATDGKPKFERFPTAVQELWHMVNDPNFRPKVTPRPPTPPPIWMLGSSHESAMLAAFLGLPYNFALFINNKMSPALFNLYRERFDPSPTGPEPRTMLTINVVCADTEEEAKRLSLSRSLGFLKFVTQRPHDGIPTVEEAENFPYTPEERAYMADRAHNAVIGTPEQVRDGILAKAEEWGADEIMTVTITYDFAARIRSYELLAEAFELRPEETAAPTPV